MLTSCPHCFGKVLPKNDSTCPRCGGMIEEGGPETVHEAMTLRKGQVLPQICFFCGDAATSFTMVKITGAMQTHQAAGRFILARLLPGLARGMSKEDSFRIDLPSCNACTDMEESKFLLASNIGARTITIRAHRSFAAAAGSS